MRNRLQVVADLDRYHRDDKCHRYHQQNDGPDPVLPLAPGFICLPAFQLNGGNGIVPF